MGKENKAKPINIKLTNEAMCLLAEAVKKMGVSRTAAIELAVRRAYSKDKLCGK